jgi:transcriptional regulator with XRE-family HTH domain
VSTDEKISTRVSRLREKLGLNQTELAKRLGISRNYLSMIELGREPSPTLAELIRLLERDADQARPDGWDTRGGSSIIEDRPRLTGRALLKQAREAKGYALKDFAKKAGYSVEVYQNIEDGSANMGEKQARKVAALLDISADDLLAGADEPPASGGVFGTVGADPGLELPPGVKARYVPLLSWAQCGRMMAYDDTAYTHDGFLVFNPEDRKTFAVQLAGDSMPPYGPGDTAIVYPSYPPRNGDFVIARLREDAGGDVMFKIYQASGDLVKLSSLNAANYPPMDFQRHHFAWIYPVAQINKTLRRG